MRYGRRCAAGILAAVCLVTAGRAADPAVEKQLDALRKTGAPITLEELDAWYITVPDAVNAARVFERAFAAYSTDDALAAPLPLVGDGAAEDLDREMTDALRTALRKYLDANRDALALLHQAAAMDRCRFTVDLTEGAAANLPYLARMRQAARLLRLETAARIDADDAPGAVASVDTSIRLARALKDEPMLISLLVRRALTAMARANLESLIQHGALTDEHLQRLALAFQTEESDADALARGLVGERCLGINLFTAQAKEQDEKEPLAEGWSLSADLEAYLHLMDRYIVAAGLPLHEGLQTAREANAAREDLPPNAVLTRVAVPTLGSLFASNAARVFDLRACMTLLAVERYRLRTDRLPDSLDALTPEFLAAVPRDPFSGKPFWAKATPEKGLRVYAEGDRRDTRGSPLKDAGTMPPIEIFEFRR